MSWRKVKLGAIVEIRGGGTPDKKVPTYWDGPIPWASVKDFRSTELKETKDSITAEGVKNSATQVIPAGNIIVPTRMAVGKAAVNTIDLAINQDLKALIASSKVDRRYLLHALLANSKQLLDQATGATVKGIKLEVLRSLEIPLPPLAEQRKIAAILDQAEELRRLRRTSIDRLRQLGPSTFQSMFDTRAENSVLRDRVPLGHLCKLVRGSSPRPQGDSRFFGGPVPRLMIADITRDGMRVIPRIDSLTEEGAKKSRFMPEGSVVMAVSGAVGLPGILGTDACIHDGFVGFRELDARVNPVFLYQFLLLERQRNEAKGTGAIWTNLTTNQVKEFEIPIPPINLQEQFVRLIQTIEMKSATLLEAANITENLFSSLQQCAFAGEL